MSRKIIDSHVHFWNPELLAYPWLNDLPKLNQPFLPNNFLEETSDHPIDGCVFVQCDAVMAQSLQEVQFVNELGKEYPFIRGIVASAPVEFGDEAKATLKELCETKLVKGIRRLLQSESNDFCLQKSFSEGLRILKEMSLPFDICISNLEQFKSVNKMVRQHQENIFILDHCGKPSISESELVGWSLAIRELSSNENVYCKLSGLLTEMSPNQTFDYLIPYLDCVLEEFGSNRILYGGDWPVCNLVGSYSKWFNGIEEYLNSLSFVEQQKIYFQNAVDVYQLNLN